MDILIFMSKVSPLLVLLLLSPCLGISDVPFIVAHKKASLKRLKSGADVSPSPLISTIKDLREWTTYDVTVTDDS
ncbi:hypothetical protein SAY87_005148 [Trapa incisa]|uniref:Uncharacterized protein n=1 Tax=Trapa incisa TaxID=236973 RepID=A0AAN7KBW0_9MYRT|nr:hypothetical protein SAY87_005148 [Trapa incisa]